MAEIASVRKVVKPDEDLQRELRFHIRRNIGQSVYLQSEPVEHPEGYRLYRLAASIPEGVTDPETGQGTVAFLKFTDLASIRVKEVAEGTEIVLPSREEVSKQILSRLSGLHERVEKAVLRSASRNIVRSSLMENALNPIEEILVTVSFEERVPYSVLKDNERYLPLLEDLGYLAKREEEYVPGPAMLQFENRFEHEALTTMLGDIVAEGFASLVTEHNLQQLVPLVRVANSYFWPSHEVNKPLLLGPDDLSFYHKRLYHGRPYPKMKLINYLSKLTSLDILEMEEKRFRAPEPMWQSFEQHAPAIA